MLTGLPEKISSSDHVLDFFEAQQLDIQPPTEEEREAKPEGVLKKILASEKSNKAPPEISVGEGNCLSRREMEDESSGGTA